ncbi:hypothetical protein TI04_06435 [Achromatium sp. WMS2]|nr:hypothetical protein TI04_06435 [Achromatium sp. WMS2]
MSSNTSSHDKYQQDLASYRIIFQQAAIGMAKVSLDGLFIDVNQKLCAMVGYTQEELQHKTFQDITYAPDLDADIAYIEKMLSKVIDTYSMEKRYICKNGSLLWVALTVSLVCLPSGEPEFFISIIEDIQQRKLTEQQLESSQKRLQAVLDASIDGFWVIRASDAKLMEVNDVYCKLSGYSRVELLGMCISDLECNEKPGDVARHMQKVIEEGGDVFVTKHRRKNNEIWPVEVTVTYSDIDGGRFFVVLRDASSEYLHHELLNLQVQLAELMRRGSIKDLSLAALDKAEVLTASSIGFFHLIDSTEEYIKLQVWSTQTIQNFCSAIGLEAHYPISQAGVWGDCVRQRQTVIHNDYKGLTHKQGLPPGHPGIVREIVVPIIRNDKILAILGVGNKQVDYTAADANILQSIGNVLFDYIEHKTSREHIEFLAYYDALTHLPNRVLLHDRLKHAIHKSMRGRESLGVAYLDLDGFKPVNDLYGHAVGDSFLIAFAERITNSLRSGDTMARLGGDEFAIILPDLASVGDAEQILWRLLEILAEPFFIQKHKIVVGASIGLTVYPLDDSSPEDLLVHADQAMYQAKWHGKNTVCIYDATKNARRHSTQKLMSELKLAFASNELRMLLQPRIELATCQVVGFEASPYWQHPQRGLICITELCLSLGDIPQNIDIVDEWLFDQAVMQLIAWEAANIHLPLNININHNSLCNTTFLDLVKARLSELPGTLATRLEISIQRPTMATASESLAQVLTDYIALGMHFTLDVCGMSCSHLGQTYRLPIRKIKLDPKLVQEATTDQGSYKKLCDLINLAREYRLPVIGQGINDLETTALLTDLGCQFGQGKVFANSLPAMLASRWYQNWHQNPCYKEIISLKTVHAHSAVLNLVINSVTEWGNAVIKLLETMVNAGNISQDNSNLILCSDQCPISRWYEKLGTFVYGKNHRFAFQEAKHRSLHTTAYNLCKLVQTPDNEQTQSEITKFKRQLANFIDDIKHLEYPRPRSSEPPQVPN